MLSVDGGDFSVLSIDGVVAREAGDVRRLTDRRGWLGDVRAGPELAEGDEASLCFYHSRNFHSLCHCFFARRGKATGMR